MTINRCRFSYTDLTVPPNSSTSTPTPPSKNSSLTSPTAEPYVKELTSLLYNPSNLTPTSTSQEILTEAKRRRKRKFTQQRRKTNTSTNELNSASTISTALTVLILQLRQRKRLTTTQNLSFLRTGNLHGTTLGQILLRILPHYYQDGR